MKAALVISLIIISGCGKIEESSDRGFLYLVEKGTTKVTVQFNMGDPYSDVKISETESEWWYHTYNGACVIRFENEAALGPPICHPKAYWEGI